MAARVVAVGYSGGRDSTALLHATLVAAAPLGIDVVALHVHHGLSPNADAWLAHGAAQCRRWRRRWPTLVHAAARVGGRPAPGESIEAWARTARYHALRALALAHGATLVLLAHHRRDQAETVLLQALRGGGVAGLAGMPRVAQREGITWARPWLDVSSDSIAAYARRHRLAWVEDESNDDVRLARNRLRAQVWPALLGAFPEAEGSLAAAGAWSADAAAALAELAAMDRVRAASGEAIDLVAWRTLSPPRRRNVLRGWLRARLGRAAAATLVVRLDAELALDRPGRWPAGAGELRSYRGRLVYVPEGSVSVGRGGVPLGGAVGPRSAGGAPREGAGVPPGDGAIPNGEGGAPRRGARASTERGSVASGERSMTRSGRDVHSGGGAAMGARLGRSRLAGPDSVLDSPSPRPVRQARDDRPLERLRIVRAGRHRLPGWGGILHVERVPEGGVAADRLAALELRPRSGGERFQRGAGRPARGLKKQYQAAGIPEWDRAGPLVYAAGELVFVPGLGIDARAQAAPGARQYALRWIPDRPEG